MGGAADRAAQTVYVKEIADSIKGMGRTPIKKGVVAYKSVDGIPTLKESSEYKYRNASLVNGNGPDPQRKQRGNAEPHESSQSWGYDRYERKV